MARIGRPDILWSVKTLARSVTKSTQACDRRLARLISYIHFTSDYRQNIVTWKMRLNIFDWDYVKIQTLQGILRIQNLRQAEFCAFLEGEHLYRSVGCAKSKRQCLTVQQNPKSSLWTLD